MIIPVILENTFGEIVNKIKSVDSVADLIQIDFVDGVIAPRKSFIEYEKLNEIETTADLEVHLMVENPLDFLRYDLKKVVKICSQIECFTGENSQKYIREFIEVSREKGYQVGFSLELDTETEVIEPYLDDLGFVQFMAVQLGNQGQPFDNSVLEKIRLFKENHPDIFIQVDGGLNCGNIKKVAKVGAEGFVVGSSIFAHGNPVEKYIELESCYE